jgi:hypothetical protein
VRWFRKIAVGGSSNGDRQRGQVVVLFALALIVILGMVSIAIDGGFGLVQARRAQNGADFASVAGARMLASMCQGGVSPTNLSINQEIQDVIDQNAPGVGTNWTGNYLDAGGAMIPKGGGGNYTTADGGSAPGTACGVEVTLRPNWQPYFAQVIGQSTQKTQANARSIYSPNVGTGAAIVALDEVSPHQVLGGGKGSFNVYGTLAANSTVPYDPWGSNHNGKRYVDVVDAKGDSNLILHGDMQIVGNNWPLDWCFGVNSVGGDSGTLYNGTPPNNPICYGGSGSANVNLQYNHIINPNSSPLADPLGVGSGGSGLADPFDKASGAGFTQGLCLGQSQPPSISALPAEVGGITTLQPGDYTFPVILPDTAHPSGNVRLADCSGAFQLDPNTIAVYPGAFRFEQGVYFSPPVGASVKGNNVMVGTGAPVPVAGNVPGSTSNNGNGNGNGNNVFVASGTGNGAPCFPSGVTTTAGAAETDGSHKCGGTSNYGVITRNQSSFQIDNNTYGTGGNFSLMLGGAGTIKLSAPTTGPFKDIALFQNRKVPGNFGFNAVAGDSAAITIDSFNGSAVVYNVSLPCRGYPMVSGSCTNSSNKPASNPFDYWDDGITFHNGGTLQAGIGAGNHPNPSSGSVTINGPCIVEDFNTDGNTTITIDGSKNQYALPGVVSSGNPPIVG